MELDPRIKTFRLTFPIKGSSSGLKPMRTYFGRVFVEATEPIAINQLRLLFEGWERVDFGAKIGASRKLIFRSSMDLLQTGDTIIDTVVAECAFDFACTMPNVNFPSAMRSSICEVAYTISASLVGSARLSQPASPPLVPVSGAGNATKDEGTACANHIVPLAFDSLPVQLAPKVLPLGVGWLKPLVMRDGIMLSEPVRRRFRRQTVQTAMNICVQVRNHCCTLGESIMVDVDATMLQRDRVLTFIRAAVIEQVALKTHLQDTQPLEPISAFLSSSNHEQGSTVVLAERTLNRKVSELDPSTLSNPSKDWGTSTAEQPLVGLNGVQNLRIRVPRKDVCTAEGFFLHFSHVMRLTFGLTSRPSNGHFDTKYATKDVPLRLVTSKFGDIGHTSQVEINKRLSALTTESDGSAVSEAYGYLLSENSRAARPASFEAYAGCTDAPGPVLARIVAPGSRPYTPVARPTSSRHPASPLSQDATDSFVCGDEQSGFSKEPPSPSPSAPQLRSPQKPFQFGPLPPVPPKRHSVVSGVASAGRNSLTLPPIRVAPAASTAAPAAPRLSRPLSADKCVSTQVSKPDSQLGSEGNGTCEPSFVEKRDADISTESLKSVRSAEACSSYLTAQEPPLADQSDSSSSNENNLDLHTPASSSIDSTRSCGSFNSEKQPDADGIQHTAQTARSLRRDDGAALAANDKRESSQSEGETIVYVPSEEGDAEDAAADTSTRSNTPDPKHPELPDLPAMEPLDSTAKDFINSSAIFVDDFDFSAYWNGCGFS
ncbi:hypothetical protein GQ54DRAFT_41086 [Martensiomyces pterosporus]|nr:hypothetical protein GQ54DRAFT_41086 [Martensiomyces pterosporus]